MPTPQRLVCHQCGHAEEAVPGTRCPDDGTALVLEADHKKWRTDAILGRVIAGKYAIFAVIGAGGMGAVYRAVQEPVGREVAVKVIRYAGPSGGQDSQGEALRGRFFREAKVAARLQNPGAVTLYDYGSEDDGVLYMVLEFIRGKRVSDVIAEGPVAPGRAVAIAVQVLNALAEAHKLGMVHRDLKPDNIMLVVGPWGEEQAKVLDFGIAKVTARDEMAATVQTSAGVVLGTPRYMAPEQAMTSNIDGRSDLYAMGVVLWEMLAGKAPFAGNTPFEVLIAHRDRPVPPMPESLAVPLALEQVVRTALAKKPSERFPDAEAMASALVAAQPPTPARGVASGAGAAISATLTPPPRPALEERPTRLPTKDGTVAMEMPTVPRRPAPDLQAGLETTMTPADGGTMRLPAEQAPLREGEWGTMNEPPSPAAGPSKALFAGIGAGLLLVAAVVGVIVFVRPGQTDGGKVVVIAAGPDAARVEPPDAARVDPPDAGPPDAAAPGPDAAVAPREPIALGKGRDGKDGRNKPPKKDAFLDDPKNQREVQDKNYKVPVF